MQGLRGLSREKVVATWEKSKHLNVQGDGLSWERGPVRDRLTRQMIRLCPCATRSGLYSIRYHLEIASMFFSGTV